MSGSLKFLKDYRRLARLFASGQAFCAFDTETTGLSSHTDRVIEIGAVNFCLQEGRPVVTGRFDALINPGMPLPPICAELSHITDAMVADKPASAAVLPGFLDFAGSSVLVAHNAAFDVKFVNAELERAGLPPLSNPVLDTLSMSRTLLPANGHWNLQFLARQFDIDVHAAHRADDDARVCMEVLLQLLQVLGEKGREAKNLAEEALEA